MKFESRPCAGLPASHLQVGQELLEVGHGAGTPGAGVGRSRGRDRGVINRPVVVLVRGVFPRIPGGGTV